MSKKDKCMQLMQNFFGPATAKLVERTMSEDDCVDRCRQKVYAMLGSAKAKEFDNIH